MTNDVLEVVVEIPKGSRNKYEMDHRTHRIRLDRVLHSSVHYPTDYGFVPDTLAEDGDPLDALVIVEEGTFPGCSAPPARWACCTWRTSTASTSSFYVSPPATRGSTPSRSSRTWLPTGCGRSRSFSRPTSSWRTRRRCRWVAGRAERRRWPPPTPAAFGPAKPRAPDLRRSDRSPYHERG